MKTELIPLNYSQYCQALSRERVRTDKKRTKLEAQLKLFQKTCKHENTRFQGDPAGGNDSCFICSLCDKAI